MILTEGKITEGDILDVLPKLPDGYFDTIFVDWPYSQMQPVRGKDIGAAGRIYGPQQFIQRVLTGLKRVAADGCHLYVFGDWRGLPDTGYTLSVTGWFPGTVIVWDKAFVGTGSFWRSSWDPIIFSSKGSAECRTDSAYANLIRVPALRTRSHPAEKPFELWSKLCTVSVRPGKRVLDAFAGSGSSRAPVEKAGGIWYGVDVDPTYSEKCAEVS